MKTTITTPTRPDLNRRDFLRTSSTGALMMLMGGELLRAEETSSEAQALTQYAATGTPVNCGLIGCGHWGREILKTAARLPSAPIVAMADSYQPAIKRAASLAPKAQCHTDYRQLLAQPEVQAVIIATPTHLHRKLVLDSLAAGKHVYCEAPLAHSIEDGRAIAGAARSAFKLNFQAGLQARSDPQRYHLVKFLRTGVLGKAASVRSQWHAKKSWRLAASNAEREQELNWRLSRTTSPGLLGEIGAHHIDVASWFLDGRPVAVSGVDSILNWDDGRDVADHAQATFEYPDGALFTCELALTHSFDSEYELFSGTFATIMWRERHAWMFKEVDSPLLGWEVYARRENFHKECGIVLDANATKQTAHAKKADDDPLAGDETPLHYALKAFVWNCHLWQSGIANFVDSYGADDEASLREYLTELAKSRLPAAGYQEAFEAAVITVKANEAITNRQRVVFKPEWFEIG